MKIKVSYSHIPNAGDLLNIHIMKNVFGIDIAQAGYLSAELSGIGSSLGEFQLSENKIRRLKQIISSKKRVYVWGTGFMNSEKNQEEPFYNHKMEFVALRGELSKNRVERLTGKDLSAIALCDGGILTSLMFDKPIEKRFELGIIPHYKEQDNPAFQRLLQLSRNSTLIDLRQEPMSVYRDIGACEYVLSSSLHGLIISDSFGIPNMHIKVSEKLLGDGFKFQDYYSCYGLQDDYFDIATGTPSIHDIVDSYRVPSLIVENKKEQMQKCFPY